VPADDAAAAVSGASAAEALAADIGAAQDDDVATSAPP
jgi:hypothetical protein